MVRNCRAMVRERVQAMRNGYDVRRNGEQVVRNCRAMVRESEQAVREGGAIKVNEV
ncbi:MAG: hypothetical protein WCP52_09655 [Bacteroidota bacterium]